MKLFDIFKKKTIEKGILKEGTEKCDHDWEVISKSDWYVLVYEFNGYTKNKEYLLKYIKRNYVFSCTNPKEFRMKNKVCLKCGECYIVEDKVQKYFKEKRKKIVERRKLANKIWNNCKSE